MSTFFTPQLTGEARQLGCPKIVLDHVRVYMFVHTTMLKYTLYWSLGTSIGDALATGIQAGTCKLMNCNMNKLYKVPDAACKPNIN